MFIDPEGVEQTICESTSFARLTRNIIHLLISIAGSALAGISALVPAGSAPEPSHKRTGPRRSCRAGGTNRHERNAPGSNSPIRRVPTARRYAGGRPLDHRTWQSRLHG